jgi:hypothetical protein
MDLLPVPRWLCIVDCIMERCLGSVAAHVLLDSDWGTALLLTPKDALFRGLLLMFFMSCPLRRREVLCRPLCPRGESRGDLRRASRSYVRLFAAVLLGVPLLFRTRCVFRIQVVEVSLLCQLLLVTGS